MRIAAISGYKPHELGIFKEDEPAIGYIKKALIREISVLLEEGLEWIIISGQLGTELWSAEVILDMKTDFPELKLAIMTPFLGQQEQWKDVKKERYEQICAQADYVESISKRPYEAPWQFKNKDKFILEKSDCLVLFYDEEKPGSPRYLYEAAKTYQEHYPFEIRTIGFYDLQLLVDEEQF